MRIAIMGAGGVGGYLAVRLAASGADVAVIARGAHLASMQSRGLRLESPLGNATASVRATDDPASIGPVHLVLFAVKLYNTAAAAEACRPLLGTDTGVVTFQNGVDSTEMLARVLERDHVVGGVAEISARVDEPGLIRHATDYARFTFGELDGRRSTRVDALADALRAAGVEHVVSPDIRVDIWRKMVFLVALSGMNTLTRLPIGPIVADPDTRILLRGAVEEPYEVARAAGVALPDDTVARTLAMLDALPSNIKASALADLEQGRRLEVPWLSGTIARMGAELGVPTPTHALIATALKLHAGGRADT